MQEKNTLSGKKANEVMYIFKLKSKAQSDVKDKDISGLSEAMKRHYDTKLHKNDPAR